MFSRIDKLGTIGVPGEPRRQSDAEVFAAECNPIHVKENVRQHWSEATPGVNEPSGADQ